MGTNPADSINFLFKESDASSTSRIDNPFSSSISESRSGIQLPQELITDILVHLPVKSLLKFKCVSKPWFSLISNLEFIRSHFSKSSSMVEADHLNLELLLATKDGMKKCCLYSALHEEDDPFTHFNGIEFLAQNKRPIVGIINGLVCLNLDGNNLCVWNPALNKMKHLNAPSGCLDVEYFYSFGYDEPNDDYKVVCLQTVVSNDRYDAEVHVYSLKAESWRIIEQLKGFYLPFPGVFANGKIYWSGDVFATPTGKIVSLDMSSDKFVELQPPEFEFDGGNCLLRMGESGGRPFVLCDYCKGHKADLWVLHKPGVEEPWCKIASIPYTDVKYCFDKRLLCISRNGEIVFGDTDGLLVYNWKKKDSRNIKLGVGMTTYWGTAAYVESLVWPPNYA